MKTLKLVGFLLAVFLLSIVFGKIFASPIHELGHLAAGLALGVSPKTVGWGFIFFENLSSTQRNLIGVSGGLAAVLFLIILYFTVSYGFKRLKTKTTKSQYKKDFFLLLIQSVLLTNILTQLFAGIAEGLSSQFYSFMQDQWVLSALLLSYSVSTLVFFFEIKPEIFDSVFGKKS